MKARRYLILLAAVMVIPMLANQAVAQEDAPPQSQPSAENTETAGENPEENTGGTDYSERLALSRQMHALRPAAEQVDSAIDSVAQQMPQSARENFKARMRNLLNYRAIERISINAMAETYTLEELEVMVEYYSKPVAQSAIAKTGQYQQKVGPEISRMIDRAVMQMRTGGAN